MTTPAHPADVHALGRAHGGWQRFVPLLTLLICAVYAEFFVLKGWLSFDEGMLGQTAERVWHGELPHRDFDEPYTGALSYLHALAFGALGERLSSPRWLLYGFFLATLPALYLLARRVAGRLPAGLITLLATALSVPNYFAAMPSWYQLFFSVFGTLALTRFLDTRRAHWLFVAGLCGGLATIIKVTGLYFLAAVLLFLAYHEQRSWSSRAVESGGKGSRAFAWFKALGLSSFVCLHVTFLRGANPEMNLLHFVLPDVVLSALVMTNEWRQGPTPLAPRLRRLAQLTAPVLVGFGLVIAAFVVPFALEGALADLYRGVFVLPRLRVEFARWPLPELSMAINGILLSAILLVTGWLGRPIPQGRWLPLVVVALVVLLIFAYTPRVYQTFFDVLRQSSPVLVIGTGLWLTWTGGKQSQCKETDSGPADARVHPGRDEDIFLLLGMAAQMALLQYPAANPMYFLYGAPLVVLAWLYVVQSQPTAPRCIYLAVLVGVLLYALIWLNTTKTGATGVIHLPQDARFELATPRCGLLVDEDSAQAYDDLVQTIHAAAAPGSPILALPDCPEVYFLSEARNPTRVLFDFFADSQTNRRERILEVLRQDPIRVVVINERINFSAPVDAELRADIEARFPNRKRIRAGRFDFTVLWRSD
jgi:Dolichyl-phosphate-mannose-protein mannosyltransferase